MKKRNYAKCAAALVLAGVLALTGCGDKNAVSAKNATVANLNQLEVEKLVTLPEYKGVALTDTASVQVSDEEVDMYLQGLRDKVESFHVYSGEVKDGDTVNIDYVGTIDGVAFDGGTASSQLLGIGSGSFIEGFESGLVGTKVGETVALNLSFPEGYRAADLAGKDCVFTVTVNYILSAITDENVSALDETYTSAEAYLTDTKDMMQSYYDYQSESSLKTDVAQYLIDNSEFKELPDSLVQDFIRIYKAELTSEAATLGMTLEDLMQASYGIEASQVDATFRTWCESLTKETLVLQAIANAENLNVTEEEVQAQLAEAESEETTASEIADMSEEDKTALVRLNMMRNKVYDFLLENANISQQ